jgi:2-C-methyl-D-erythritol 4-phosphate cytidylyltransferase
LLAPVAPVTVVAGGAERQESVALALAAVPPDIDIVLVHDAARALTPPELIESVAAAVRSGAPAAIPVLPVVDTIKEVGPPPESGAPSPSSGRSSPRSTSAAAAPSTAAAVGGAGVPLEVVLGTVDRAVLRIVQTPQGFRHDVLAAAHASAVDPLTDDAGLVEKAGVPVSCVPGSELAMKITRPLDLILAEALLHVR